MAKALLSLSLVFALAAAAAAEQLPGITPEVDVDGVWELEEHGARQSDAKPLVRIKRTNNIVAAVFISGAECFDGTVREYLFVGDLKLEPLLNPPWLLNSTKLWVCSGTPSLKEECGGKIPSNYISKFSAAKVTHDTISGDRFSQGYKDCALDAASNGTASFTLTRATCGEEAQTAALREREFRTKVQSILDARGDFIVAFDAARRRYGDTYRGRPVADLQYPANVMHMTDLFEYEALVFAMPDLFESSEWTNARLMASEMGIADDPGLAEARRMLEQIYRIEAAAADLKQAHRALLDARDALAACRKGI